MLTSNDSPAITNYNGMAELVEAGDPVALGESN